MRKQGILAIDAGTTGTRALVLAEDGNTVGQAYRDLPVSYPNPGWVEQDAIVIWEKTLAVVREAIQAAKQAGVSLVGLAISNQRETSLVWDAVTGRPLHPAVVWQCRRTMATCQDLKDAGHETLIRSKTGLPIDPYFSATKLAWLLDNVPEARSLAEKGRVRAGTVDSWLIWQLTGGEIHRTDVSNASRTQLMDIASLTWDETLAQLFRVPTECLPEICASAGKIGETSGVTGLPDGLPILAVAGDSQAALFGETAFAFGAAKVTYGTGSSILINAGKQVPKTQGSLAVTVAWQVGGEVTYALEGIIHCTGAAVEWLRTIGLIEHASETEDMARRVNDTDGVVFVPAFVGLGTPWWDARARALFIGMTRGTRREHLVRAVLDSIAYQVYDVFAAARKTQSEVVEGEVYAGGGGSRNGYLMQLQADLLQRPVITARNPEASCLGVAYLAGIAAGMWTEQDLKVFHHRLRDREYLPQISQAARDALLTPWHRAVRRSLEWEMKSNPN